MNQRAGDKRVRLTLSCGCEIDAPEPEGFPWQKGEATLCDDDAHASELVDVMEVHRG